MAWPGPAVSPLTQTPALPSFALLWAASADLCSQTYAFFSQLFYHTNECHLPLQPLLNPFSHRPWTHPPPFYLRTFVLTGLYGLENPISTTLWTFSSNAHCSPAYLISPSTLCDFCPSMDFLSLSFYLFIVSSLNSRILRSGPKCACHSCWVLDSLQCLTHSRCS